MSGIRLCVCVWVLMGLMLNLMVVKATEESHSHPDAFNVTTDVTRTESDDVNANIINDDTKWQDEPSPTGLEITSPTVPPLPMTTSNEPEEAITEEMTSVRDSTTLMTSTINDVTRAVAMTKKSAGAETFTDHSTTHSDTQEITDLSLSADQGEQQTSSISSRITDAASSTTLPAIAVNTTQRSVSTPNETYSSSSSSSSLAGTHKTSSEAGKTSAGETSTLIKQTVAVKSTTSVSSSSSSSSSLMTMMTSTEKPTTSVSEKLTASTEPGVTTSTTARSTTDCLAAIKVDDLNSLRKGQTNMTLTWEPMSSMSRVRAVYRVKVKGREGDDTCFVYTVGNGTVSEPLDSDDGQLGIRQTCKTMSKRLTPVGGTIVIRDLQPCTTYDVTVTSECGTCPCNVADTSASKSFETLAAVPGRVEEIHQELNDSDTSRVRVTWTVPASADTCRVQRYLLKVFMGSTCVTQVNLLGKDDERRDGGNVVVVEEEEEVDDDSICKDSVTAYGSLTSPKVVVNNLLPDTLYTLNVTAINDVGASLPASHDFKTAVAVPSSPTQFIVMHVTSDSVTLTWMPPEPRPGPMQYFIQLLDMGSPYNPHPRLLHNSSRHCVTGYDKSNCTVDELWPYWTYNFTLTAHTAKGDSVPAVLADLVTTQAAAPGIVEKMKVEADDKATAVTVTWYCPTLKHRNTRIVGFLLRSLIQSKKAEGNETADVMHVSTQDCDVKHSAIFDVIPEHQYFFQVLTLGEKYNATQKTTVPYYAPARRSEAVSSLSAQDVGATNVTLQWSRPLVTNGHLTGYGVKVMGQGSSCLQWTSVVLEKSEVSGQLMNTRTIFPWTNCKTRDPINKFAPGNQNVTLTLNDLPPDTSVTLYVYPKNNAGWGFPSNVSVRTEETVPTAPTHISLWAINATTLNIGWQSPEPRPGATNYSIVLNRATELNNHSLTFTSATSMTLMGWSQRGAVVTHLWSGWRYSLTLTAFTSKGSSRPVQRGPVQMPQSQPDKVENMSVSAVANDYRHVMVTWDYPPLRDRHGVIVNFTSCCRRQGSKRNHCQTVQQPFQPTSPQFCATFNVIPGRNYTLKVQANNEFRGVSREHNFYATIGPPPDYPQVPVTSSVSKGNSQSSFSLMYCAPCLLNNSNGEITLIALLVCRDPFCQQVNTTTLNNHAYVKSLPTWKVAKGVNFISVYRPTGDAWLNSVRTLLESGASRVATNRSRDIVYTVGEEEDCESRDRDDHCNGPLPAGQAFRVLSISCTSASCTPSALSEPVFTENGPAEEVSALTIAGSILGVGLGLLVVLVIFIYQRQRRRHKPKGGVSSETEGEELSDMTHSHRTVTIQDYGDRLRQWKSVLHDETGFPSALVQQFAEIRDITPRRSKAAANLEENKMKNRYTNILPYDHSRVKLVQLNDDVTTDYINANYIPGYHSKGEYIASQGPLERIVDDFWRMVWEQCCPVIVMLSALTEGRLNKVYKYFPDEDQLNEPVCYGMVTVTLLEVHPHEDYLVRTFRLSVGRDQREVKQFFVDSWKDFKANLTPSMVLEFVRAVREEVPPDNKHPLLVHCSAGVGRTGTWIAIDYFMHYIRNSLPTAPINIQDFVVTMRQNRVHMVQSLEQYVFLHEVVADLVRRKTEVDRYDEPAYRNEPVYANLAYDHESDVNPPSSSFSSDRKNSGSNNNSNEDDDDDNSENSDNRNSRNSSNSSSSSDKRAAPPSQSMSTRVKGTPTRPPRSRSSVISAVTSRM